MIHFAIIANILFFLGLLAGLFHFQQKQLTLSRLVLIGLIAGSLFGLGLHYIYADSTQIITQTLDWVNIVGGGYISLLKMVIMPLVLISMIAAVVKLERSGSLGKIGGIAISVLLMTTAIAAIIGIFVANVFGLSAEGMVAGTREIAAQETILNKLSLVSELTLPQMILSFIPDNPFADLAGSRSTSTIAVVIFGILLGIAARKVMHEKPALSHSIAAFVDTLQTIIMRLVKMVIALTPYGIAGLMTKVIATSSPDDILDLINFILASYCAIFLMFLVHGVFVALVGVNPIAFFKKISPVLTFAFSSRSSAATIPLNVETQISALKVPQSIANLSATFGATIGQNGCAGIYPAMLAVMVAPSVGIDPMSINFILPLIGIIVISSFGIAGIGGGATFAALIVLPTMGLPVAIVALLISIEPLIDMARTALNVSGAMTAGTVTSRLLEDKKVLNAEMMQENLVQK